MRKRRPRKQSWRGKTLLERVKLLEAENNALNKTVLDLRERLALVDKRVENLEWHPPSCSCTRCTG